MHLSQNHLEIYRKCATREKSPATVNVFNAEQNANSRQAKCPRFRWSDRAFAVWHLNDEPNLPGLKNLCPHCGGRQIK
jgi:hypothetical protein